MFASGLRLSRWLLIAPFVVGALYAAVATANHDPGSASVDIVAVDADPSGNLPTDIGPIDACRSITPGETFDVDIVIDQALDEGIGLFGFDVRYDPTVLRVDAVDAAQMLAAQGSFTPFAQRDELPDSDGDYRIDFVDLSGSNETGEGVVLRVTATAIGTGASPISIDDFGGVPLVGNPASGQWEVRNVFGSLVRVGEGCPSLADLRANSVTLSAPANAVAGESFPVSVSGVIENLGPTSPTAADVTITLNAPPDCTATGGLQRTVTDVALDAGTPYTLPDESFDVTCAAGSNHSFSASVTVAPADPSVTDTNPQNNSASSVASTAAIVADVDLKVSGVSLSADPSPATADMPFTISAAVTFHNNGPSGPAPAVAFTNLNLPPDCRTMLVAPSLQHQLMLPVSSAVVVNPSWRVQCSGTGNHSFALDADVAPGLHLTDTTPANDSASGSLVVQVKAGVCGADPAPAGDLVQNLSPQLITIIQTLTADGEPLPAEDGAQMDCRFDLTLRDTSGSEVEGCPAKGLLTPLTGCAFQMHLSIDQVGGSPDAEPTTRVVPVGVYFVPMEFAWPQDPAVPNGTEVGYGDFSIRTDAGLGPNGVECGIDVRFPHTPGIEGGIPPNVPESNLAEDLTNPDVWPNDLNSERALVESSLALAAPLPGLPPIPTLELWSRMIVPLQLVDQALPLNVLTWKVTNPVMATITGAEWVVVAFPGDALNPDPAGAIGGDVDADDPQEFPMITCAPHSMTLGWTGLAGNQPYISCDGLLPGNPMVWALVDPDAVNVTGDEGPRSDTGACAMDSDGDGITDAAEPQWGTNPNVPDTDADGVSDGLDNCKAATNAGQLNTDGDPLGDACDNCPAAANAAQENTDSDALGNACDNCPSTPNDSQANSDSDPLGNACDNCPAVANPAQDNSDGDPYGDVCDNCLTTPTGWAVPAGDEDCDGFLADVETFVGTEPAIMCMGTPIPNDEDSADAWPVDLDDNQLANTLDVGRYVGRLNSMSPNSPYIARLDMNGDGRVNTLDVGRFVPFLNRSCAP